MRTPGSLLGAALLAGCAVGPDYREPVTPAPAAGIFLETDATSAVDAGVEPEANWWRLYSDPLLDALIADAFAANTDLRVAAANIARARGFLRESRSARLPSTEATAGYSFGRASGAGLPTGFAPDDASLFSLGASVGYEVDFFGRVRRLVEAARRDVEAEQALLDAARVAIAADTALAYADACAAAEQRRVAERTLAILERSLAITTRTFEAGRGTRLDVDRARTLVEQTRATIPVFQAQQTASIYAVALLTGRTPAQVPQAVRDCARTPRLARPIPVGDGAGLLARRPDIRAAERRLAADTARIGIATADLYPRVTLGGSAGFAETALGDLFTSGGFNYSVGPLLTFSFPNQEAARGRILTAEGTAAASLAAFDRAVLSALRETETAISALGRELDRRAALITARDAAANAARLSRLRQTEGLDPFLTVLDAERTLAEREAELARSGQQIADNQIALFRALGGGWQNAPALPSGRPRFDGSADGRAETMQQAAAARP